MKMMKKINGMILKRGNICNRLYLLFIILLQHMYIYYIGLGTCTSVQITDNLFGTRCLRRGLVKSLSIGIISCSDDDLGLALVDFRVFILTLWTGESIRYCIIVSLMYDMIMLICQ